MQPKRVRRWPGAAGDRWHGARGGGDAQKACLPLATIALIEAARFLTARWWRIPCSARGMARSLSSTGRVVAGPAQEKIKVYSTKI